MERTAANPCPPLGRFARPKPSPAGGGGGFDATEIFIAQ